MRAPVAPIGWPRAIAPAVDVDLLPGRARGPGRTRSPAPRRPRSARSGRRRRASEPRLLEERPDRRDRADPHARGVDARRRPRRDARRAARRPTASASSSVARTSAARAVGDRRRSCRRGRCPAGRRRAAASPAPRRWCRAEGARPRRPRRRPSSRRRRPERSRRRSARPRRAAAPRGAANSTAYASCSARRIPYSRASVSAVSPMSWPQSGQRNPSRYMPSTTSAWPIRIPKRARGSRYGVGGHALRAAGEHHVVLARRDRQSAERDGLERGRAGLVDREGRDRVRHAGAPGHLAGGVRPAPGLARVPEDRLVHRGRRAGPSARARPEPRPRRAPPASATRRSRRTCRSESGRRRGRRPVASGAEVIKTRKSPPHPMPAAIRARSRSRGAPHPNPLPSGEGVRGAAAKLWRKLAA